MKLSFKIMTISWLTITYYAYWVLLIYVTFQIIQQYTISSRASAWLFTVYLFPVIGLFLYFIFGVKRRKRKLYQQKLISTQNSLEEYQSRFSEDSEMMITSNPRKLQQFYGLIQLIERDNSSRLTVKNKLTLLENGEQKFPKLFADIEAAQQTIHLEYYIFRFDEIGSQLIRLLIKKAKAGLAVRIIYDDYGSLGLNQLVLNRMRSHGIEIFPFAEIRWFAFTERLNYRNHRKIVVIDDRIAYVGGINIGDEYFNDKSSSACEFWRDSHLRVEGQEARYLQNIFLTDWNFCANQAVEIENDPSRKVHDIEESEYKMMQVVASGPDSPEPSILFTILHAIHIAKSEILITTPYFIPNPALLKALKIAVLRGLDVKLLVPNQSDSKFVNSAAQSFYYELMLVGVTIYKYTQGFIHTKTMVVDNFLSIMGTANFDERSFELNFEVNVMIYDQGFAQQLKDSFNKDITDAKKLSIDSWHKRSFIRIFIEKLARLISPIL